MNILDEQLVSTRPKYYRAKESGGKCPDLFFLVKKFDCKVTVGVTIARPKLWPASDQFGDFEYSG